MRSVQDARIRKTLEFLKDKQGYADKLTAELALLEVRALKKGYTPVARLNGTSDTPWESYIDMEALPNIQFYDYTKNYMRMQSWLREMLPFNYHLTYSNDEHTTFAERHFILAKGGNVAVVFRNSIPITGKGTL